MNQAINRENQILYSISNSNTIAINASIEALTHLIANLKLYKQCMADSMKLLSVKNTYNDKIAPPFQSHNLPGVLSFSQILNLQNIKTDDKIKKDKEQVLRQKRILFRLIQKDSKIFIKALRSFELSDASFEEFLEIISDNIDLNIQPHKLNNERMKPTNIKFTVDKELIE